MLNNNIVNDRYTISKQSLFMDRCLTLWWYIECTFS